MCVTTGKQKPDPEFYSEVVRYLEVEPGSCIFIDDRLILLPGLVSYRPIPFVLFLSDILGLRRTLDKRHDIDIRGTSLLSGVSAYSGSARSIRHVCMSRCRTRHFYYKSLMFSA